MTDRQDAEQLELGLELSELVPAPWWAEIIKHETEGDQDTGWWGA